MNHKMSPFPISVRNTYNKKDILDEFSYIFDTLKTTEQYKNRLLNMYNFMKNSPIAMFSVAMDGTVLWANPAAERLTGYTKAELVGNPMSMVRSGYHEKAFYEAMDTALLEEGMWHGEVWNRKKNGTLYLQWMWMYTMEDEEGTPLYYTSVCFDVSHSNKPFETLSARINHDFMTGLPTKYRLGVDIERLKYQEITREDNNHYLVLLEINRYSDINIAHGYRVGDDIAQYVSNEIAKHVREKDSLYLIERGQYAILAIDHNYHSLLMHLMEIRDHFKMPIDVGDSHVQVSLGIGVSIYGKDTQAYEQLLRNAELALREAKKQGIDYPRIYSHDLTVQADKWYQMREALHSPDIWEQLEVYYQPIVNTDLKVVAGEALLRWNHPIRGLVMPGEFIPYIEQSGFIVSVGYWVIEQVFMSMQEQRKLCDHRIVYCINLSLNQLREPDFVKSVLVLCEKYGIDPYLVTFEITESQAMSNVESLVNVFDDLKAKGFQIALDDFGKGHSSLSVLSDLNLNTIKVDKSFITAASAKSKRELLVATMYSMISGLGLKGVAEGVETQEDLEMVSKYKFDAIQGYFISKALKKDDYYRFVRNNLCINDENSPENS